jgi:outer membrane protein TolC
VSRSLSGLGHLPGRRAVLRLGLLGLAALLSLGCASVDDEDPWLLPEHSPPGLETPAERVQEASLAVLGSGVQTYGARWEGGVLVLEHVLTSVHDTYPLLSAVRQELVLAQAEQLKALGAFDLKLKASALWGATGFYENHSAKGVLEQQTGLYGLKAWGGYRLGAGDFDPTFDGKRVTNHGGEFSAGLSLPLLRGGSIDEARRGLWASAYEREIAKDSFAMRQIRFEQEAAVAYWRWVAAGRRLEVAQNLLDLAQVRQEATLARVRRGALPEIEGVDNQRLVVKRQSLVIKVQREVQKTAIALSLFLRDARGATLRPSADSLPVQFPSATPPNLEGLSTDLMRALELRPDLKRYARLRERAELDLRFANNRLLPQLDVFVAGSQDRDGRRPSVTKGEFELTAGLEFSFPFQNRKARGQVAAAQAKLDALADKERFLRDKVEAEVRDALSALQAAYRQAGLARETATLAERVAEAERRRFALGDSDVLRLNLREEAVAEARLGLIDALLHYWSAAATYRASVGVARGGATPTS